MKQTLFRRNLFLEKKIDRLLQIQTCEDIFLRLGWGKNANNFGIGGTSSIHDGWASYQILESSKQCNERRGIRKTQSIIQYADRPIFPHYNFSRPVRRICPSGRGQCQQKCGEFRQLWLVELGESIQSDMTRFLPTDWLPASFPWILFVWCEGK